MVEPNDTEPPRFEVVPSPFGGWGLQDNRLGFIDSIGTKEQAEAELAKAIAEPDLMRCQRTRRPGDVEA